MCELTANSDSSNPRDAAADTVVETKMNQQKFVVVGCGMVGVILAIELKRFFPDCSLTVLERRTEAEVTEGSWMIGLSTFGLKALSNNPVLFEKIKKSGGQPINRMKKSVYINKRLVGITENEYQTCAADKDLNYIIAIDRGTTLKTCLSHLKEEYPDVDILFGHELVEIDEEKSALKADPPLSFTEFDLLFGTDGANSKVRRCCDSISRESQVTPFFLDLLVRRVVSTPSEMPDISSADGMGIYMSTKPLPGLEPKIKSVYSPIAKGLQNYVLTFPTMFRTDDGQEMLITDVLIHRDRIKLSEPLFPQTQEALEADLRQLGLPKSIYEKVELGNDSQERAIYTVKATKYHNAAGNVVILGDAAHATFPSLSGGYQTGLQDVYALLDCLLKCESKKEALVEYSKQQVPIGRALVDISNLITYSPGSVVSSAGTSTLIGFLGRLFCHCFTCGKVKPPHPFLYIAGNKSRDVYTAYLSGKKTTVELADEWRKEIIRMNKDLEMWSKDQREEYNLKWH